MYRKMNCQQTCNYQIKSLSSASVDPSVLLGAFSEIIVANSSSLQHIPYTEAEEEKDKIFSHHHNERKVVEPLHITIYQCAHRRGLKADLDGLQVCRQFLELNFSIVQKAFELNWFGINISSVQRYTSTHNHTNTDQ
jgi:hypothetical protein